MAMKKRIIRFPKPMEEATLDPEGKDPSGHGSLAAPPGPPMSPMKPHRYIKGISKPPLALAPYGCY